MTWINLQEEVLEQFSDIRWHGMNLLSLPAAHEYEYEVATVLPDGLVSISENDNWQVVARKTDDTFAVRVRELVADRFVCKAQDVSQEIGNGSHGDAVSVGRVLGLTPGWVQIRPMNRSWIWANKDAVLALCRQHTHIATSEIAKQTGVPKRTIADWLKAEGWAPSRIGNTSVWLQVNLNLGVTK